MKSFTKVKLSIILKLKIIQISITDKRKNILSAGPSLPFRFQTL